jgi:hypothetical protein
MAAKDLEGWVIRAHPPPRSRRTCAFTTGLTGGCRPRLTKAEREGRAFARHFGTVIEGLSQQRHRGTEGDGGIENTSGWSVCHSGFLRVSLRIPAYGSVGSAYTPAHRVRVCRCARRANGWSAAVSAAGRAAFSPRGGWRAEGAMHDPPPTRGGGAGRLRSGRRRPHLPRPAHAEVRHPRRVHGDDVRLHQSDPLADRGRDLSFSLSILSIFLPIVVPVALALLVFALLPPDETRAPRAGHHVRRATGWSSVGACVASQRN